MAASPLDALVDSLLWEGYALYPYTPGATKNATPTPFGIVYPPAYAAHNPSCHDRSRIECILEAPDEAEISASIRFLQYSGERHRASERRIELGPFAVGDLAASGSGETFSFAGEPRLEGRARMRATSLGDGLYRIAACAHNTTALEPADVGRAEALRASMISTHVVATTAAGRFISPLEREGRPGAAVESCESVNTWPVLASPADDAVLGAAIFLPDHPSTAPESLGNLFDSTEIEEALLLHVQVLSDGEREEISAQDPAVREMIERASAATPEQMIGLHGRLEIADPGPPPEPGHPNPGESELTIGGRTFRKGGRVVLRPDTTRDVYDGMLAGRTATIERLYLDYDDGAHIAVTIDGDAAQPLFRETGRYLFFRADEVEPA